MIEAFPIVFEVCLNIQELVEMLLCLLLLLRELLPQRSELINSDLPLFSCCGFRGGLLFYWGSLRFCCLGSLLFLLLFRGPCLLFGGLLRGRLPKIGLMADPLDSVSGTREFERAKAFSYKFFGRPKQLVPISVGDS